MAARAVVLFDIDGTLVRKAGPHHRRSLEFAVHKVLGITSTTDGIPTQGMLDSDILREMLLRAGVASTRIRNAMPDLYRTAENHYLRTVPNLESKRCPGARMLLWRLHQKLVPAGLVTGNLSRIGWKKMERAGLKQYLHFGAFAGSARDRAGLVKLALGQARQQGWLERSTAVTLIGDHPNDILAAKANGIRVVAVATGVVGADELRLHQPDLLVPDLRTLGMDFLLSQ